MFLRPDQCARQLNSVRNRFACFTTCLILLAPAAFARANQAQAIDDFCASIRREFAEADPAYFTGPDPWTKLDRLPDACASSPQDDTAASSPCDLNGLVVATVYQDGPDVKWVILQMQAPADRWFETTQYFFSESGEIEKRERLLNQYASHIQIQENQYFAHRKLVKTSYRHRLLNESGHNADKEDWDTFFDPNAPFYTTIRDLPMAFRQNEPQHLALLTQAFQCPC